MSIGFPKTAPFLTSSPEEFREYRVYGIGGVAGAGKTTMSGLAGKDRKVLMIDLEGGSTTFTGSFFKDHPDKSDVSIVSMFGPEYNDPTKLAAGIIGPLEYLAGTKNKEGYDVVVIDSLTEFQERFVINFKGDNFATYRELGNAFHKMVQTAQAVPAHVVFTSRLTLREDSVLGHEIVRFSLAEKSWSVISGGLDVIGYKTVRTKGFGKAATEEHIFDARQTSRFAGKDRFGIGEMVDPTMKKLITLTTGGKA